MALNYDYMDVEHLPRSCNTFENISKLWLAEEYVYAR